MNSPCTSAMAAMLLLAGCATSPLELEVANHGMSLATQLEGQLATYATPLRPT